MIATNDEGLDVVRQVRRSNVPCDLATPCCVRRYNSLMGAVDRMDQLRSYYTVGRAGRRWWKYVFRGLLNIGIINAYILWKKMNHPLPANTRLSSLKTWKMRLIHNMVDDYVSRRVQRCEPAVDNLSVERVMADNIVPGHPLVRFSGRKRTCKQCARQKTKTAKGRYVVSCFGWSVCKVYLCRTGCFVAFHRDMHWMWTMRHTGVKFVWQWTDMPAPWSHTVIAFFKTGYYAINVVAINYLWM